MRKSKTKYLTYIEDTPKHIGVLSKIVGKAGKVAVASAKKSQLSVTYVDGKNIVKETASGKKTVIGTVAEPRRKVKKGEQLQLH